MGGVLAKRRSMALWEDNHSRCIHRMGGRALGTEEGTRNIRKRPMSRCRKRGIAHSAPAQER
jgi:hypothetical protein